MWVLGRSRIVFFSLFFAFHGAQIEASPIRKCVDAIKNLPVSAKLSVAAGMLLFSTPLWVPDAANRFDEYRRDRALAKEQAFWKKPRTAAEVFQIISDYHIREQTNVIYAAVIPEEIFQVGTADEWAVVYLKEIRIYFSHGRLVNGKMRAEFNVENVGYTFRSLKTLEIVSERLIRSHNWQSISTNQRDEWYQVLITLQTTVDGLSLMYANRYSLPQNTLSPDYANFFRLLAHETDPSQGSRFKQFGLLAQTVAKLPVRPN